MPAWADGVEVEVVVVELDADAAEVGLEEVGLLSEVAWEWELKLAVRMTRRRSKTEIPVLKRLVVSNINDIPLLGTRKPLPLEATAEAVKLSPTAENPVCIAGSTSP